MDRREFIRTGVAAGAIYSLGGMPGIVSQSSAGFQAVNSRIVANIMLMGGPDWRHVFPPAFNGDSGTYGHRFWKSRARSFAIGGDNSSLQRHWDSNFDKRSNNGINFGISKACPWLRQRWDEGNLAIVTNTVGSKSRDHAHSILVMNQGNRASRPNDVGRSGWGGRLASVTGKNVVALTASPSEFCNGLHTSGNINLTDTTNLISARNTRLLALYEADPNARYSWDTQANMTRALKAYYKAKRAEIPANSPYRIFVEHERKLREFGQQINDQLSDLPPPALLEKLHDRRSSDRERLTNAEFGLQLRNLYDALACNQVLNMGVASLEYGGWDSHEGQARFIEPNLHDMFGPDRGLERLWRSLPANALNNMVLVIGGEFGRQLVANGGNGTDHGRGTSYLVIGKPVRGGVYGDMFPEQELARLSDPSPDITGLTDIDHVFGAVCDWASPGAGSRVFPNRANAAIEPGLGLNRLFA